MSPIFGFPGFLLLTLVLLAAVVVTGKRAERKRHLPLVALTVVSLGTTIYWAERLGELYHFDNAGWIYPFHLTVAKIATAAYLAPLFTGLRTLKHPAMRRIHGRVAYLVLGLTVLTAITGTWMVLAAERHPVP